MMIMVVMKKKISADGSSDVWRAGVRLRTFVEVGARRAITTTTNTGNDDDDRTMLKTEIGCVWDSRFSGPDAWRCGRPRNDIHERLVTARDAIRTLVVDGEMGFDGENCVERCSSDWFRYGRGVYDESVPIFNRRRVGKIFDGDDASEIHAARPCANGSIGIVVSERAKNESRWLPSVKLIADVPLILRRIIDTAKDFRILRRIICTGRSRRERYRPVTIFFDQHLFEGSIITLAREPSVVYIFLRRRD